MHPERYFLDPDAVLLPFYYQGSSRTTTLSNAKAAAPKPTGPSVVNADKVKFCGIGRKGVKIRNSWSSKYQQHGLRAQNISKPVR
eukprot:750391-Hanusia_phi.AAC.10